MTRSNAGGCLCGKMRYRLGESVRAGSICYCVDCRRASGAPGVAWVAVRRREFFLLSGELKRIQHAKRIRSFADCCGAPITVQDADGSEWIDVTTCSMDNPELHPPQAAVWTEDCLSWVPGLSSLVAFQRDREQT